MQTLIALYVLVAWASLVSATKDGSIPVSEISEERFPMTQLIARSQVLQKRVKGASMTATERKRKSREDPAYKARENMMARERNANLSGDAKKTKSDRAKALYRQRKKDGRFMKAKKEDIKRKGENSDTLAPPVNLKQGSPSPDAQRAGTPDFARSPSPLYPSAPQTDGLVQARPSSPFDRAPKSNPRGDTPEWGKSPDASPPRDMGLGIDG